MKYIFSILIVVSSSALLLMNSCNTNEVTGSSSMPDTVSYNFDIRPILSDKCYACHGPDKNKRKAGLRLDIADSAYAALKETKGAYALVPYKPDISELYKRVSSTDTSFMMPPPASHLSALTPIEVALIKNG